MLWQVLRSFNTEEGLVQAIVALYENSSGAAVLNSQLVVPFEPIFSEKHGTSKEPQES